MCRSRSIPSGAENRRLLNHTDFCVFPKAVDSILLIVLPTPSGVQSTESVRGRSSTIKGRMSIASQVPGSDLGRMLQGSL